MMKMFKIFLPLTLLTGLLFSQSIEANWQLGAAIVEYTYVVRDSVSAEDATAGYAVTGSWPSSANAAITRSLVEYDVGDTITVVSVPLINETFLAMFGVAMNVNLNDDGTFTINEGSTYLTTNTENLSRLAARWSLNPAALKPEVFAASTGITGDLFPATSESETE